MQVLFSKILGTFCPQRKSSVPGPFAKASAAQPAPLARLIFYFMDRALRSYRVEHAALCTQASTQCVLHGMAELLHQIKYTDLIGLGQVS